MRRFFSIIAVFYLFVATVASARTVGSDQRNEILKAREAVWRAWFNNDQATLKELVPEETIVFSSDEAKWKRQADILRTAAEFQQQGGKLTRLDFPHTEIQRFGDVAVVWSNFIVETETNGKKSVDAGRASEIFVLRNDKWVNPGWHTDPKQ